MQVKIQEQLQHCNPQRDSTNQWYLLFTQGLTGLIGKGSSTSAPRQSSCLNCLDMQDVQRVVGPCTLKQGSEPWQVALSLNKTPIATVKNSQAVTSLGLFAPWKCLAAKSTRRKVACASSVESDSEDPSDLCGRNADDNVLQAVTQHE